MKYLVASILIFVVALTLGGCIFTTGLEGGSQTPRPDRMSLAEAKAIAIEMESAIEQVIPPEYVASIAQRKTGTLLGCSGGKHKWASSSLVTLIPGSDVAKPLEAVRAHFNSIKGYRAKITVIPMDKASSVEINGPDYGDKGANFYYVDEAVHGPAIDILSFSPCFYLEKGVYPGGDF